MSLLDPLTTEPPLSPPDPVACAGERKDSPLHDWRYIRCTTLRDGDTASLYVCNQCGEEDVT